MQDIVTNMRGTRAFDKSAGRVVTLALAASALGLIAPAQSAHAAPRAHRSIWAIRWDAAHPALAAAYHRSHRSAARAARPHFAALPARPRIRVADFPPTRYVPVGVVRVAAPPAPLPRRTAPRC